MVLLEDKAESAVAKARQLLFREVEGTRSVDLEGARGRCVESP